MRGLPFVDQLIEIEEIPTSLALMAVKSPGCVARVEVELVTDAVWVDTLLVLAQTPAWIPLYAVLVESPVIARVVFPVPNTPNEELETLKFPSLPVEIAIAAPAALVFLPNITETEVVNTWNPTTDGDTASVLVEAVIATVCVLAFEPLSLVPAWNA